LNVVSNSSPIIALSDIDRLDVLKALFVKILIPRGVVEEVTGRRSLPTESWIRIVDITGIDQYRTLRTDLDHGESEAIVACQEQHADMLLVDDAEARRMARTFGIRVMGTGGVLVLAKRRGLIPSVGEALERLERDGAFRLSAAVREVLLREADE
jgi:predicted nucleic acid-binding protein